MEKLQRVKRHFLLVGFTKTIKNFDLTNEERLNYVLNKVNFQFGKKPLVVYNKQKILSGSEDVYPQCYAAGWYLSLGQNPTELIVIAHGDNLKHAQSNLDFAIKYTDWHKCSQKI